MLTLLQPLGSSGTSGPAGAVCGPRPERVTLSTPSLQLHVCVEAPIPGGRKKADQSALPLPLPRALGSVKSEQSLVDPLLDAGAAKV